MDFTSAIKYGSIAVLALIIITSLIAGLHYMKKSWAMEARAQQLETSIIAQKIEGDKVIAAIVAEKNGAVKRAATIAKQLEVLKHAKANPADDSLINAAQWVQRQPDPYREVQSSGGADAGYPTACSGVLNQVTIAEYITNQFAALEDCRGKLFELRKMNDIR